MKNVADVTITLFHQKEQPFYPPRFLKQMAELTTISTRCGFEPLFGGGFFLYKNFSGYNTINLVDGIKATQKEQHLEHYLSRLKVGDIIKIKRWELWEVVVRRINKNRQGGLSSITASNNERYGVEEVYFEGETTFEIRDNAKFWYISPTTTRCQEEQLENLLQEKFPEIWERWVERRRRNK